MTNPASTIKRRHFLAAGAALAATPALAQQNRRRNFDGAPAGGPVVIASGNGLECVERARRLIAGGADPAEAIVRGVEINENDPDDMTVGYGGLPNERGVVSLDACVMHGPMHRSGAVAAIENIKNPAAVALEVARRTDHCMIVGEGARTFARQLGFKEENLLTEKARKAWLEWKANHSRNDDWLNEDEFDLPTQRDPSASLSSSEGERAGVRAQNLPRGQRASDPHPLPFSRGEGRVRGSSTSPPFFSERPTGTIHCSAVTGAGDLAGCTTTSGLAWKIPGRIGDSPLIGAGCYTDNDVGSAGATGRGEAVIQTAGARTVVMRMQMGDHPRDACLYALQHIADKTKAERLLDDRGRPSFNVVFYALRKDGEHAAACFRGRRDYAVATAAGAKLRRCDTLYDD